MKPLNQDRLALLSDGPWTAWSASRLPDGTITTARTGVAESQQAIAPPAMTEVPPAEIGRLLEEFDRSARTLTPFRVEFAVHPPDQPPRWFEARAVPQARADGAVHWQGLSVDVTERKEAEALLRGAYTVLTDLIDQAPLAIAMLDIDLRYVAYSQRWLTAFGGGRSSLIGLSHYEVATDLDERYVRAHREGLAGRSVSAEDDLYIDADGTRRWLRWAVHPWRDSRGAVGGIIIWIEDVTHRKEAEDLVQASEARLHGIIHSVLDAIVTVDESHHIVLANAAAERMFGYEPGTMLGMHLDALIPPAHRGPHATAMRSFAERDTPQRAMGGGASLPALHSSGEVFPIETSVSKVTVGGRSYFTAVHRDLAPRLRAEGDLAGERERFRQLAEAIREVFWLMDVETESVLYVSPAYETIWGRPSESLVGHPGAWMEAVHPDDLDAVIAALPAQLEGRYDLEYRILRPDGAERWVHARAFPIADASGRVVRVAGVAEDITGRRLLEEQVRQTQRLESMGRLAGGVAHDFNNLLTVILSSVDLLEEGLESVEEGMEDIRNAAGRGATLTRQLLAFTRQEVIEPRVTDLSSIVGDAERLLRRIIGEDIDVVTSFDPDSGPVRVDPGQWSQVVFNLAVNARDAMPDGGGLRISTYPSARGPSTAPPGPDGAWEVLEVSDTGCGMSPEVRRRLFEPFFTTKGRGQGTGLGLAVVYGVVQQAGGAIEVETAEGAGTTFRLFIPRCSDPGASPAEAREAHARGGHELVILVEDEEEVRRVAARILRVHGYRVEEAKAGGDALALLDDRDPPRALITDIVLPGMDGTRLAEQMRTRFPGLKVLFTSGYLDESLTRRDRGSAHDAFLQKPYTPQTLAARLRQLIDEAEPLDA